MMLSSRVGDQSQSAVMTIREGVQRKIWQARNNVQREDGIEGVWKNVGYKVQEVHLEKTSGNDSGNSTVFKGIVFEIACPVHMPTMPWCLGHSPSLPPYSLIFQLPQIAWSESIT